VFCLEARFQADRAMMSRTLGGPQTIHNPSQQ
jgi:hypothetical protein